MPPPSPAQLALAMAIVKAKPPHLDIKDHILQIRQFIKDKRPRNQPIPEDNSKFFDSVSFWQQAYEKSEAEQSRLLDRIYELESRNEALIDKLQPQSQTQSGGVDAVDTGTGKRKTNHTANSKGNTGSAGARKRAKTQAVSRPLGSRADEVQGLDDGEFLEEATASFMRQFYTLQKTLQKRPTRSSIVLAAVNLSKVAESEILGVVDEKGTPGRSRTAVLQTERPSVSATIRSVECAFHLLCHALGKLSGTEQDVRETGQLTYHMVCLYDSVMTTLQKHCQMKTQQETTNPSSNARTKKQRSLRAKTVRTRTTIPSKSEDETATQITRLLATMTLSLDISSNTNKNQDLLEGFLFILLTRIGKLLSLFVFRDLQLRPGLYIDPSKIPLPEGLNGVDLSESSLLATEMEAKRLIWILERILARLHVDSVSASEAETEAETVDCRGFVERIKDRLQSTLLQAVFGSDQAFFREVFNRPTLPDLPLDTMLGPQEPEKSTPDWFVQEIWRLLGWEMLMN